MRGLAPASASWTAYLTVLVTLCTLFTPAVTVKYDNFKTCDQSGFCKRNRAYADDVAAAASWTAPYRIASDSLTLAGGQLQGTVLKTIASDGTTVRLPLTISFLESGIARVTIDEEKRQKGEIELRHGSAARKERYNEAEKWSIVGGLTLNQNAKLVASDAAETTVQYGANNEFEAVIKHSPFGIDFKRNGATEIRFNDRGLMNMEHWRPKVDGHESGLDESTWWEETFGGNTDSKPRGPESVALDISFLGYQHVYGIPEHTGPMSLKETRGGDGKYTDPYRLYNSDVFEYVIDSPMTLYGAIPLMQAQRKDSTVAVFWLNAAETWVDIVKSTGSSNPLALGVGARTDTKTHWMSETGVMDVFVFLGPTPRDITKAYGELTGYTQLPQEFSLGYHQCRWNYITDEDVKDVDRKMDKFDIPYDVIWLDLEYTDGKKYFTWDPMTFPDPIGMGRQLDQSDRKLVIIIDPHIKNVDNYPVVKAMKDKDLAVRNKDGDIYDGWCWPGSSHWLDAFNPKAVEWWKTLFKLDYFTGTLSNTFIWNDMNEPSVFNGPETTMPKDNLHHELWEHRDIHNLNGLTFVNATFEALLVREKSPRRPFVLTRSFFAGSQRYGAMWTGDNQASWEYLKESLPMVLNNGISGFPFAGADVGGFFGNPDKDLQTRWYQAGAFYPFFRAHAHIDTRRREPYLLGEPYTGIMTQALRLRYSLLPVWYTAFHEASVDGTPIVRPNYFMFPGDEHGFGLDDQLYVGSSGLLAKPITAKDAESVDVYLADDETYFDYFDFTIHSGPGMTTVSAPLDKIPLLMQGGHIIPRKDRPRRSSGLMKYDPYTLVMVLGNAGTAHGELYVDDGESYDYQSGAYFHRRFEYTTDKLTSTNLGSKGKLTDKYHDAMKGVHVEKIIVVNAPSSWQGKTHVKVEIDGNLKSVEIEYHDNAAGKASWALVKNPRVAIGDDWTVDFS